MLRKGFVMAVNPGQEIEYETRHNPIWPELKQTLEAHGVLNYSIFIHPETRQLFAYVEIESEERWLAIAQTEVCQRWWRSMSEIMPSQSDHSPISLTLKEVFHMDNSAATTVN